MCRSALNSSKAPMTSKIIGVMLKSLSIGLSHIYYEKIVCFSQLLNQHGHSCKGAGKMTSYSRVQQMLYLL